MSASTRASRRGKSMAAAPINGYLVCGGFVPRHGFRTSGTAQVAGASMSAFGFAVAEDYRDVSAIAAADFLVTYTCDVHARCGATALLAVILVHGRPLACTAWHEFSARVSQRPWLGGAARAPRIHGRCSAASSLRIRRSSLTGSRSAMRRTAGCRLDAFEADDELYLCGVSRRESCPAAHPLSRRSAGIRGAALAGRGLRCRTTKR